MRKLNRRGTTPVCLASYRHGLNTWKDVTPADKTVIWVELDGMQGNRCAYCERDISSGDKHIEHFRQRSHYVQGTFAWDNLFGSCNSVDSCGKHKDSYGVYNPADLIKPDVEDPEKFFVFVSDGTIAVRHGLSAQDQHRAHETLRIFNLDAQHGPLRWMRLQATAGYIQTGDYLREMATEFDEVDWLPLLQDELEATSSLPFATAIKHVLLP